MKVGSPAISGAAIATAAMNSSSAEPMTMVGLRRAKTRNPEGFAGAATWVSAMSVMSVPDPRVEQGVGQVDKQVHQHVDAGEQDDDALDDRIVAPRDGVHHQAADAGDVENGLGDHH